MRCSLEGTTVLVTGASSGIGRELALLSAQRGAKKLGLVARRIDRLQQVREELLRQNAALEVRLLQCDLANADDTRALIERLPSELGAIDVLVNNAGVGDFAPFDRADWTRIEKLIALNVTSLVALTHALVPPMVARKKGGVLNVSSGYGFAFSPGLAAYCGSKHFVTAFTEALRLDLAGTGVVITQVCPGPVATEFDAVAGTTMVPSWMHLDAARCARAALRGLERGRAMVVPGLLMKFARLILALSPRFMQRLAQLPFARRFRALPPRAD